MINLNFSFDNIKQIDAEVQACFTFHLLVKAGNSQFQAVLLQETILKTLPLACTINVELLGYLQSLAPCYTIML